MIKKQLFPGICASIGILILILDGNTALIGAQAGIDLCIKTVIPSLFPFILLSILLTGYVSGATLPFLKPLGRICGIPNGAEAVLLVGFFGGYPTGAQAVSSAYLSGQIHKSDADRMLSFCNNAGPAFLFGMISSMFPEKRAIFFLWGIHIISAILTAALLPVPDSQFSKSSVPKKTTMVQAMRTAVNVMATICGWVILFRVIIAFLDRWFLWMLPVVLQVVITGFLELSNGCCELSRIVDPQLRFLICSGILSMGGLCVTLQTSSVTQGLSMNTYLKGKAFQTVFSLLISTSVILKIWMPVLALLLFLAMLVQKTQKRSGNPYVAGV